MFIVVNPYQELDIYSQDEALAYSHTSDKSTLPPHVFAGTKIQQNINYSLSNSC